MPQEVELWYVLPALRRELAKIMISESKLSQKRAAELLCVTESAISQYKTAKRAGSISFGEPVAAELRKSAKRIIDDSSVLMRELVRLTKFLRKSSEVCRIHRDLEDVPKDCRACRS